MLLLLQLPVAAMAGFASHQVLFIRGEWHMQAPIVLRVYVTLIVLTCITEILGGDEILGNLKRSFMVIATYATSLFTSMTIYRILFHRLRSFPGPFWAAVSKFWHVVKCVQMTSQNHVILDGLHKQYGDFVRTGMRTS